MGSYTVNAHQDIGPDGTEKVPPKKLSDRDILAYTAADAFALTTDKPWELEVSSKRLRHFAWLVIVVVMAVHIFMGITVGIGYTGASITPIDQWGFVGVGVVLSIVAYIAFTRPRVRVNPDGVEVRNLIGTRFYPWTVIYGLTFPENARIARLELPEFEFVPMWAMQSADGERVVKAVSDFRVLEARYMPED